MNLTQRIVALSDQLEEHTLKIRRAIHSHPELSFDEKRTSELVKRELSRMGIPWENSPAEPGVVGMIDSKKPGKLVLLRADMDALPIRETTGLPFASQTEGVMHACGHDVHTANLLAVAEILQNTKDAWNGRVKLVFQPGEESGGGGRQMVEQGLLDEKPDACFAIHVMPGEPGIFTVGSGPLTAYSNAFWITVHGRAAHSSTPEMGVDAIQIAASMITHLNLLTAKSVSPLTSSTLSVGCIKGGAALNVVADTVELSGIMRNATLEARTTMLRRLEETVKGTAAMMGGTADVRYRIGYASVYNNEELAAFASRLFARRQAELFAGIGDGAMAAGDFLRTGSQLTLDAEDFGFYSEKAPSLMVWIGTGGKALRHQPDFLVEEPYIKLCTRAMALLAAEFLGDGSERGSISE